MLPESLTEEAVARWMLAIECCGLESITEAAIVEELRLSPYPAIARAVLALVEAKVREAVVLTQDDPGHVESVRAASAIVSRIMGEEVRRG